MIPTLTSTTVSPDLNTTSFDSDALTECRNVHSVSLDARCFFVQQTHDCEVESVIDYMQFLYCTMDPDIHWAGILISIIWTLILFVSLGVAATDFLCPALFLISKSLKMSQNVAGVTLIAFGNGSPDVFAAIAGMIQGRPELVIGALFGGACFVVMIVLGSIFSVKSFRLVPVSFLRDITFYAISASWVFYLFVGPKTITLVDGICLLLFYGFYVGLVVCSRFFKRWQKDKQKDGGKKAADNKGKGHAESGKQELNRIVFEGIRPDDDPSSGMVVMKKFILYGPDGMTEHSKIHPLDDDHEVKRRSSRRERRSSADPETDVGKEQKDQKEQQANGTTQSGKPGVKKSVTRSATTVGTTSGGTKVSAKTAVSRLWQHQLSHGSSIDMRNIVNPSPCPAAKSKSVPDIRVEEFTKQQQANQDEDSFADMDEVAGNTPYSTINHNTISSILNNRNNNHYYVRNNAAAVIAANMQANEMTVTSMKSVSICEDNNSVYDTVTSYTRDMMPYRNMDRLKVNGRMGRRHSATSTMSKFSQMSRETRLAVKRASRDIFEKIKPIDATGWQHRNWGGKGMEVIKAPIRFFLLLTTPTIDVDPHAPPAAKDEEGDECDTMEWNKPISCLHCITGPLFVVFATGLWKINLGPVPLWALVLVAATIVSCALIFTSKYETPPSYYKTYCSFLGFIVGVCWVYFISTEVVSNIRALGVAFNLSEPTIGMTILAVGNCLLDFISNVSIARKGYPRMAISACLGSPLLALLLGVGIPSVIKTASGPAIDLIPTPQLVVIYTVIMSSLTLTVLVAVAFKFVAKRWYGVTIIVLYFVVIAIVLLIEFNVIPVHFSILDERHEV